MAWFTSCIVALLLASSSSVRVLADFVTVSSNGALSDEHTTITDDDYCDLPDGSDETKTSACSFMKNFEFVCAQNEGLAAFTIPTSRVNDGICDCCDGSDESQNANLVVPCPDTCGDDLMAQKKEALAAYRVIQAGLRARTELIAALKRKNLKEKKSFDALLEERKDIYKLEMMMKLILLREEPKERKMRWKLIREREARCAEYFELASPFYFNKSWALDNTAESASVLVCENLFYQKYFDDDELKHEGYKRQGNKKSDEADPHKQSRSKYSAKELRNLQKLNGLERTRKSICKSDYLLPDDDAKIFTQVGEFVNFYNSKGGGAYNKRTIRELRRSTLFGTILEDGSRGHLVAAILPCELLGFILSPATLLLRGAVWFIQTRVLHNVWDFTVECGSWHIGYLSDACNVLLDTDRAGTLPFNVVRALDYSRYSSLNAVVDYFLGILSVPIWMGNIVWLAPKLYYDYYWGSKDIQLPPHRKCCLLRDGIATAEVELAKLDERIAEELQLQRLRAQETEEARAKQGLLGGAVSKSVSLFAGGYRGKAGQENIFDEKTGKRRKKKTNSDWGPSASWEHYRSTCTHNVVGEYNYSFCFFDKIMQNDVVLGYWNQWGEPAGGFASGDIDGDGEKDGSKNDEIDLSMYLDEEEGWGKKNMEGAKVDPSSIRAWIPSVQNLLYSIPFTEPARRGLAVWSDWLSDSYQQQHLNLQAVIHEWTGIELDGTSWGIGGMRSEDKAQKYSPQHPSQFSQGNDVRLPKADDIKYSMQFYDEGTACNSKPLYQRRTLVTFVCDAEVDLREVIEVEVCTYSLVVSCPLACLYSMEDAASKKLHDLGIFGFSKSNN